MWLVVLVVLAPVLALPGTFGPPKRSFIRSELSEPLQRQVMEGQPSPEEVAQLQQLFRLVQRLQTQNTTDALKNLTNFVTNSTHIQDQATAADDQVVTDPWLEDDNRTSPRTDLPITKGTSPQAPTGTGAAIPVNMPPVPVILCEIMCIGKAFEKCVRPCSWAIGCGLKTVADDSIMNKLMPQMLELDSFVGSDLANVEHKWSESFHRHTQSNSYNHSNTLAALQQELWLADLFQNVTSLADIKALPWLNRTTHSLKQLMSDDLCKHNLALCLFRDLVGATPTVHLLQTWMSTRISLAAGMELGERAQLTSMTETSTGFILNAFKFMVKPFCEVSRAWPPNRGKGYCGWFCGYAKDETCIMTCLADTGCCGLWYCLSSKGTSLSALEQCQKSFCWTESIGCNNLDLSIPTLNKMIRQPYDTPAIKMKYDETTLFPFWKPPYRMDGKSLGAIGLNRVDLYPYREIGWMGGGIGFRGHTMGTAVYGY
eukprot:c33165_g1_i1.p1 GENE.c33165_g1_i1~~c33165_g1_i1.p1  ORF type:complete len:485 (+),score=62.92 c33165_g1_i1:40-1494(+)